MTHGTLAAYTNRQCRCVPCEALAHVDDWLTGTSKRLLQPDHIALVSNAARERLTQLPETCERCNGAGYADDDTGRIDRYEEECRECNGFGRVYPADMVLRVAETLHEYQWKTNVIRAIAVLETLNERP